jgi:pimeloyl-ACP methyl ester carboxylesterase
MAEDRSHWAPVVELLADRYRCVSVDLLGHGTSPDGAFDLFGQVGAVSMLLDRLGLDRPVVIGHSYGGFIATFLGIVRPLRGVVNVDQTFDTAAFREALQPLAAALREPATFDATLAAMFEGMGLGLVPEPLATNARAAMRPRQEVVMAVWDGVIDTPAEDLAAQVEGALPAVAAPYLGIFGADLSAEERRLQSLVPHGAVEVWDGLGHFLLLVDPDRTAQRIAAFVDGLD